VLPIEMGHDHNGKPIYKWDHNTQTVNKNEIWDDVANIVNEVKKPNIPKKFTFEIDSNTALNKRILVPRYFWNSREKEIEKIAKEQKELIIEKDRQLLEKNNQISILVDQIKEKDIQISKLLELFFNR